MLEARSCCSGRKYRFCDLIVAGRPICGCIQEDEEAMKVMGVRVTLRRAGAFAVMLAAIAVLVGGVMLVAAKSYSATAEVVVLGPSATTTGTGTATTQVNPYFNLNNSPSIVSNVLAYEATSTDSVKMIAAEGGSTTYTVNQDNPPTLQITATARQSAVAIKTADLVVDRISSLLTQDQAKLELPAGQSATLITVIRAGSASREWKKPTEIGLGIGVLGFAAAAIGMRIFDRRESMRATSPPDDGTSDVVEQVGTASTVRPG